MPRRPPLRGRLALALVVGPALGSLAACSSHTVTVTPPVPSGAVQELCATAGTHLPARLEGLHSRVVRPHSPLTHAWGTPPIVLRCGVGTPAGYVKASAETTDVDGVEWFQHVGTDTVTWTAIRATADVELVVPSSYRAQGPFLVDLAPALLTIR